MDDKDEYILRALLSNSRASLSSIAGGLGISETAVRKRMKKLEANGAIRAYTAIVDPYYLGYEGVALVGIDTKPERLLAVLDEVKGMPEVRYAALTSGDHMMMFEVWCRTQEELAALLDMVGNIEGVSRICPAIFLKRM